MENRIAEALAKLFQNHRIVFWYDTKTELRHEFESVDLPNVEKLRIASNEFAVKYRILREQPENKFLLYHEGPRPSDIDNWLLDVQLAHVEFRTDQEAIWLSELELGSEFFDLVRMHPEFFQSTKRKEGLKRLLKQDDSLGAVRLKMLSVCTGSEPRIDSILEHLLAELSTKREEKFTLISRCHLDGFLWEQMERVYGYKSEEPSVRDFVIQLFKSCYAMELDHDVTGLTPDALVFLKRWKDSRNFEQSFELLSAECAEVLSIEQDLEQRDFRSLLGLDYFRLIDRKIISSLVTCVATRTASSSDVSSWIRQRRQTHWYKECRDLYESIDHAAQFIQTLNQVQFSMTSLADGIQRYCASWFRLDQLYRKFSYHVRASGQTSLMLDLTEQVENLYSNNFLLKVNDLWQIIIDALPSWDPQPIALQKNFFELWVRTFLNKDNKICVIISDALRYEIGEELLGLIRQEDRYDATIEPCVSMLPSYTQLGMAALLPNKSLSLSDNDSATVQVDGHPSQGTANRSKILARSTASRGTAVKAEQLMALNKEDCRALVRDHDVIYVYHNRIDATGDKRESEDRVFEAVEQTLEELVRLMKKLAGANVSNILITSDHGFIYQNKPIAESDFTDAETSGAQILFRHRRFVLGKALQDNPSLRRFSSTDLGLKGDIDVQIPKSINRLRLKGSGSRFVHGGSALQEIVIPVLKINKKRQSDTSTVEVDILGASNTVITAGQLTVSFYQASPVTEKTHPRMLRAAIYTQDGTLLSDLHNLKFDSTSENPRDREVQVRFVLTREADEANGQEVVLCLDEKETGTTHYKKYQSRRYLLRRSFTTDFDF